MKALTLELQPEMYRRLYEIAARLGKPPQVMAQEWLVERLTLPITTRDSDREKARQALNTAGLLTELSPNLRQFADPTVRLEDVSAALGQAGGKTLSEIVLEQRGARG
jgi:predicted transcriptional regulator